MGWILGVMGVSSAGLLDFRSDTKRTARRARVARKKALRQAHLLIAEAYVADVWITPVRSEVTPATPTDSPARR